MRTPSPAATASRPAEPHNKPKTEDDLSSVFSLMLLPYLFLPSRLPALRAARAQISEKVTCPAAKEIKTSSQAIVSAASSKEQGCLQAAA